MTYPRETKTCTNCGYEWDSGLEETEDARQLMAMYWRFACDEILECPKCPNSARGRKGSFRRFLTLQRIEEKWKVR